ncbi:MAG: aminotransferase class I/II-fold pyridoxal phosphate-dependent enzyme [Candidatus Accumulibacter sp.]|jgi:dTDP-4-amino-4,6-dideoxygalactose transaminase|nr:aminotransferase class I/II-fold pyridoxal phosphate-dependent enzyme [Accumulibacter sp.]
MNKRTVEQFALFGGESAFASFRTTMNLVLPDRDVFFRYAKASFDARHMTDHGPAAQELEKQLAEFHDVRHCVTFCNCFTGMFLALHHLARPGKTEVVMPSLTYRRMADIVDWAGLLPHFCDVDAKTLGVTPAVVEPCLNENTALILAPQPITHLCDIRGLETLAAKYDLPLFFDSVEACGGVSQGKTIGGFGDGESFSMHPSKVLNSCEGGYITTNKDEFASTLRKARAFGLGDAGRVELLGCNARLNELHAAMGLATLAGIEQQFADNQRVHLAYQRHLADLPGVTVISYDRNERRNWKSLLLRLDDAWPFGREETLRILNAENIHARAHYSPAQHTTFPRQAATGALPVTDAAAKNHLILPFGSTVSEADTEIVGSLFRAVLDLQKPLRARLS